MARRSLPAFLLLALGSAAWADDDALLPTHLIEAGQVFGTATVRYIGGKGDVSFLGAAGKLDQSFLQLQLDAGVGLGAGFEVDASITSQWIGDTTAKFGGANTELESLSRGFGDLVVEGRYRLLKDDVALPQLVLGAIVVAPTGNDKDGQPGITVGSTQTQSKEESGIGQGVWRYGVEAGISKNLVVVEPYLATSYVFGDKRTKNGVKEDRADVWSLMMGAEWNVTPQATIDTRAILARPGVDKQESGGTTAKEESHMTYTGMVHLYVKLGGPLTLVFGGGVTFVQDHQVSDVAQLELEDDYAWFINVGLHLLLGGK